MTVSSSTGARPGARGTTLVEVLVVLVILGVLSALVLSALGAAREMARRGVCSNHLRQFGTALHQFESTRRALPPFNRYSFSAHAMLLPFLERESVANAMNFDRPRDASPTEITEETSIDLFLCPSDPTPEGWSGSTNYAVNVDTWARTAAFGPDPTSLGAISDGTSQTVAAAEFVAAIRGPAGGSYDLPETFDRPDPLARACDRVDPASAGLGTNRGRFWSLGEAPCTVYNHILGINANSCTNGTSIGRGVWTAGSRHPGGANALYLDGHVTFTRDGTSLATWRAVGTRAGCEIVSGP